MKLYEVRRTYTVVETCYVNAASQDDAVALCHGEDELIQVRRMADGSEEDGATLVGHRTTYADGETSYENVSVTREWNIDGKDAVDLMYEEGLM